MTMNFQLKLIRLPDKGNYVIMLAKGLIDGAAFNKILTEVSQATQPLLDCKVLIDLQDATVSFSPSDFELLLTDAKLDQWSHNNKVAVVSAPQCDHLKSLIRIITCLTNLNIRVSGFDSVTTAVEWLTANS